jgi:hypothetical protein
MSIRRVGSTGEQRAVDNDSLFVRVNDDQQRRLARPFADGTAGGWTVRREATRAGALACIDRNSGDIRSPNLRDPARNRAFIA